MKLFSKLSLSLIFYILLYGTVFSKTPKSIVDLDQIADLLKFPRSELLIVDYINQEKFIYSKKDVNEENSGRMPPVDPESIYKSYLIASKTPNAFLPIVVTISKANAYLTPKVKKTIEGLNAYAATQRSQGGHFSYGDFEIPGASYATMFWEEIRVPAHSNLVIEPGDTWSKPDQYPKYHPANVSIVRDVTSGVDVRIAQYACLYYPNKLIKLPGGEDYFAAFNDNPGANPNKDSLINMFKGLNEIVINSPIMTTYRKSQTASQPQPTGTEVTTPTKDLFAPPSKSKDTVALLHAPNVAVLAVLLLAAIVGVILILIYAKRKKNDVSSKTGT